MSFSGRTAGVYPFGGAGYAGLTGNTVLTSGSGVFRNILSFTNIVVKDSNGVTTLPLNGSLGSTIPVNLGDMILTTITNTAITSSFTSTKTVDKTKTSAGDTLTYTLALNNLGNTTAQNILFLDTIPSNTSFIDNSLTINAITVPGVNPSTGVSIPDIGPGTVSTVTFQVQVQC